VVIAMDVVMVMFIGGEKIPAAQGATRSTAPF
jgi:hypothetical protein